ncbi:Mu-like prophage FluMu I protein [Pandoraea captiosa]|uniref:Mu-like prophage FluMu I protein n=1 Tax=Pandoraea captiosa TaxID=2508302 RepID=A0A5E4ZFA8_9BURK|nr:phage protease [Pandoraea captiosa]VVE59794.1 Mu-like prophage FluMu I protein [Pandoraea captiosa]
MAKHIHIAALSALEFDPASRALKLLPAGAFRARDGRPTDCPAWHMDGEIAQALIAAAANRAVPYCIDYEHQSLNAAKNGQPAPAAGWFKTLEWREGDGLYAIDPDWTERAAAWIAAKEYRFLSPVFGYDDDGNVTFLLNVALTNNPALDCLDEVQLAAATVMLASLSATAGALPADPTQEESAMDELLEQLRWLLNMPVGSTAEDVQAQLKKLIDALSEGKGVAAASVNLPQLLENQRQSIAALSANQLNLATHAPIAIVDDLRQQLAAANAKLVGTEVNDLVVAALADGRLLQSQEAWARELGASNVDRLKKYLETAQPIAALTTTQTGGKPPAGAKAADTGLDAAQLAVCTAMGIAPEDFARTNALAG